MNILIIESFFDMLILLLWFAAAAAAAASSFYDFFLILMKFIEHFVMDALITDKRVYSQSFYCFYFFE